MEENRENADRPGVVRQILFYFFSYSLFGEKHFLHGISLNERERTGELAAAVCTALSIGINSSNNMAILVFGKLQLLYLNIVEKTSVL